jgi:hypothetical protein
MGGIAVDGGAGLARGQDAGLALDAQVEVTQARHLGDPPDERRRAMGVEVVGDADPHAPPGTGYSIVRLHRAGA